MRGYSFVAAFLNSFRSKLGPLSNGSSGASSRSPSKKDGSKRTLCVGWLALCRLFRRMPRRAEASAISCATSGGTSSSEVLSSHATYGPADMANAVEGGWKANLAAAGRLRQRGRAKPQPATRSDCRPWAAKSQTVC